MLETDRVLQIRRSDVEQRIETAGAETATALFQEERWAALDVAGQVAALGVVPCTAEYVRIPASYVAGVSLFARAGSPAAAALAAAADAYTTGAPLPCPPAAALLDPAVLAPTPRELGLGTPDGSGAGAATSTPLSWPSSAFRRSASPPC